MKMDYERTFLFADPHFYHKNIIGYENRPFKDVYEMNDIIISNWNNNGIFIKFLLFFIP